MKFSAVSLLVLGAGAGVGEHIITFPLSDRPLYVQHLADERTYEQPNMRLQLPFA